MRKISREQLLEAIFQEDFASLKGKTLRLTRVRVPGTEVCFADVFTPKDEAVFQTMALHIGVHEGKNYLGKTVGIIRFTPWEAVVAAADVAVKAANVEIGFMDRFCGSLILLGEFDAVKTAVEEVVRYFGEELHFGSCKVVYS